MQIGLLGPFEVRLDGGALADVPGARLRALLAALALDPGRVVPKASLIDWIWGEHPPADAANALQRLASRLRKVLPADTVDGQPGGYRLVIEPDGVDVTRFEQLVARAGTDQDPRLLRDALALWRGTALQEVGLTDSDAFDAAVTRLEGLRLAALEDRFDAEVGLGRGAELVTELTDLVAANPVRERLVGALMRALVATGRDTDALLVYQRTRETLADTLGVDPSPELAGLHVALLRGELGGRAEHPRTNLRAELTSFVGKDADLAAIRDLVAAHRLTTLIGPGGSGKTRSAMETARTLLGDLPDGAWLVELAPIGVDGDVAQATLDALRLRDALLSGPPDAEPTDRVIAALRDRDAVLVLDNCEHVIERAAAFAHRVLGECRRLRILATSREPLGITGEALWHVEPLALPGETASAEEIEASPAVRLLRDRAGAVRQDLGDLATMARVCRALDGMPLAIELAAARLRTMSLDQLANRLDDRFRLLTGGSRTAMPQHRTLRAVVDWSWELLSDAERVVLRRLSVFSGGASIEAAERVCASDAVDPRDVLELLTALTEKSLLVAEGADAPRYRMLGTIKEYAAQRLAEAGETDLARQAHLACFTDLAETADPQLRRAGQVTWLATLELEHDNIAAAMRGGLAAGEAQAVLRLAAGAGWFWWLGGHKAEGMELLTAATEVPGDVPDEVRATVYALIVLFVSSGRGDEHHAAHWIHEAYRLSEHSTSRDPRLQLTRPLEHMLRNPGDLLSAWEPLLDNEDPWVRALARLHCGKMRIVLGRAGEDADAFLAAALGEFRALGERFGIWFALTELADRVAMRGELAKAGELLDEAVVAVTEVGAIDEVIRLRSRQAQLYWMLGDADASTAALADAHRCAERVTWPSALAELSFAKAELARWAGDPEAARAHLGNATSVLGDEAASPNVRAVTNDQLGYLTADLARAREHHATACAAATEAGHAPLISVVLLGVADYALRADRPGEAARLLAASVQVRGLSDRSSPDVLRIDRDARDRLGDGEFAEATLAGTRTPWTELVAVTLAS